MVTLSVKFRLVLTHISGYEFPSYWSIDHLYWSIPDLFPAYHLKWLIHVLDDTWWTGTYYVFCTISDGTSNIDICLREAGQVY